MGRALWLKIGAIAFIALALLMPLKLIESKIEERQATRAGVVKELANTSVGEQSISGPLLLLPCTEHYISEEVNAQGARAKERRTRDCTRTVVPDGLSVTGSLATENRFRGIYSARFFIAKLRFEGRFGAQSETPAPAVSRGRGARRYC